MNLPVGLVQLSPVFHLFVDRVAEGHFAATGLSTGQDFDGTGRREILLALFHPSDCQRAQFDGQVLATDGFSSPPNGDPGEPSGAAVFALPLDDGTDRVAVSFAEPCGNGLHRQVTRQQ
ncbi:MAG: hypothetical protein AAF677_15370 [Pseudomonadota bacterium]